MNKYNNSKIYKILSNREPKYYYIGSTVSDLKTRLRRHRSDSKVNPNVKKNNFFNSIDWDVQILLIQDVNVSNFLELRDIENNYIQQFINDEFCLNTYFATINIEKRKEKIKENSKKYYFNNIDTMKEKHNNYYLKTKNEKQKQYEDNKEAINEKRRNKIICECGITISKGYKSAHIKSKCHITSLLNKEKNM